MEDSNPLLSVFSAEDLAKLEQGLDIESNGNANDDVCYMLTDPFNRDTQSAIADWFQVADKKGAKEHLRHRLRHSLRKKEGCLQTLGEVMAGWFLYENLDKGVEYRCGQKGADFRLSIGDSPVDCEVKSAVGGIPAGRYCGPGVPVTRKVRAWFDKIASQLEEETANIVLVVDWWRPGITPHYVLDALYGSSVVEMAVQLTPSASDPLPEPSFVRLPDGKLRSKQLTRVSAVGVLRFVPMDTEWRIHGWFVHNLYAARPIPPKALGAFPELEPLADKSGLCWRRGIGFNGLPIQEE